MGSPTTVTMSTLSQVLKEPRVILLLVCTHKGQDQDPVIRNAGYNRRGSGPTLPCLSCPLPPAQKCIYSINDSGRYRKKQLLGLLFFVRLYPRYKKRNLEDTEESLKQGSLS